jgi:hypothetical protein
MCCSYRRSEDIAISIFSNHLQNFGNTTVYGVMSQKIGIFINNSDALYIYFLVRERNFMQHRQYALRRVVS